MKFYNLSNDYLFKKIFTKEKYLKQLLFDLFEVKIDTIEYLNAELLKTNKINKVGIVDMLLKVNGEIVILELQNLDRHNFKERLLFYSSNIISNYCLSESEDYNKLRNIKVYAIVNYNLLNDKIMNKVNLKTENRIFTSKLEYQIFDLSKVDKNNQRNKYYEIVNLFKNNNKEELDKLIKSKIYKEILDEMKKYNIESEEREKMDEIAQMMINETEHYDTAYRVGKKAGIDEGISQGITTGISQGKMQRSSEIAKNLLEQNIDLSIISKVTNLSIDDINNLK